MAEDNSELLNTLIGMLGDNPEQKIAAALSTLGVGGEENGQPQKSEPETSAGSQGTELDALLQIGNLLSNVNGEDERARLLNALKPFLSEDKRPKVDNAVKLLKLAKMAEAAGKTDLLKNFKL